MDAGLRARVHARLKKDPYCLERTKCRKATRALHLSMHVHDKVKPFGTRLDEMMSPKMT